MKHAKIGSVSSGTMRPSDLLDRFADELEGLILLNGDHFSRPENFSERDRLNNLVGECHDALSAESTDDDHARDLVDKLFDALEMFAPAYCYFGAHPDDGADYGFWPDMDAINDLPSVDDPAGVDEMGEDCKSVNDHGNLTVYDADGNALLELV